MALRRTDFDLIQPLIMLLFSPVCKKCEEIECFHDETYTSCRVPAWYWASQNSIPFVPHQRILMLWQVQTLDLSAHHGRSGAEDFAMMVKNVFNNCCFILVGCFAPQNIPKQENKVRSTLEFRRFLSVLRPVSVLLHLLHLYPHQWQK